MLLYTPMIENYTSDIKIIMTLETGYLCDTIACCISIDISTA